MLNEVKHLGKRSTNFELHTEILPMKGTVPSQG